jgi:hypothetical protein
MYDVEMVDSTERALEALMFSQQWNIDHIQDWKIVDDEDGLKNLDLIHRVRVAIDDVIAYREARRRLCTIDADYRILNFDR